MLKSEEGWEGGRGGGGSVTFCMDHTSGDLVKSMVVTIEVGPSSALVEQTAR